MPIVLEGFIGAMPKINPRLLPPNAAAIATDVRLESGDIAPMRGNQQIHNFGAADAQTFYRFAGTWFSFPDTGSKCAPAPTQSARLIITRPGSTPPEVWTAATGRDVLAVNAPTSAPLNFVPIIYSNPGRTERVFYAQTYVTSLGEESRPSPLSVMVEGAYGRGIAMTLPGTGGGSGSRITHRRIYRSKTTASGATELFFRNQVPIAQTTFDDVWHENDLQEPCPSVDWHVPPQNMRGVISLPNGIMAAHTVHEILFSEPYVPHAWPRKYSLTIPETIVALVAFGTSMAVLTDGNPYVVQGLHPDSMTMEKMEAPYPCVSARGATDMGYSAIYPSHDGLVEITSTAARLVSAPIWTREQWGLLRPSQSVGGYFNGRYAMRAWTGFWTVILIDLTGPTPYIINTTTPVSDMQQDMAGSRLMVLEAGRVSYFDSASEPHLVASWRSKPVEHSPTETYGAAMVHASTVRAGSTVTIFGDGKLLATIPHSVFNRPVRLPSGRYTDWQVSFSGQSIITKITVAKTPHEAAAL